MFAAVLAAVLAPPTASRADAAACGDGRWVTTAQLLNAPLQAIVIEEGRIRIGTLCAPVRARLKGKKKTKVRAVFAQCGTLRGKVKLEATIEPGCGFMQGKVTGRRAGVKERFTAPRCNDGIVDASRGEPCDGAAGCGGAQVCSETTCRCTTPTTTTTSTLPPGSTTTTLPPFRYIGFSGAETGVAEEYTEDNQCVPVTSPVRSGSWACQIPLGSFAKLRPCCFSEKTVYVRAYHRIDVVTPPAVESFAPVFVMDVTPAGKAVADVAVSPDGRIRYRLRNRVTKTTLGMSDFLAPGRFVRVELATTIGEGTGSAELRIDGVTAVTATGQDFGDQNLDAVFISNNPAPADDPSGYSGANGGDWMATFDDLAVTVGGFPGEGRVVARQGAAGAPAYDQWTKIGGATVADVWSDTPADPDTRAETPASGTPLAQTVRVAPFDQGPDAIGPATVVKACQTWLNVGLVGGPPNRTYAIRRRLGGADVDTPIPDFTIPNPEQQNFLRSDGILGGYFAPTPAELATAEIGAVKFGDPGGTPLRVTDAWLSCEVQ